MQRLSASAPCPAVGHATGGTVSKAVLNHDGSVGKHYGAWVCGCTSRASLALGAQVHCEFLVLRLLTSTCASGVHDHDSL